MKNTVPTDEYYELIVAARNSYEATKDAMPDNPLPGWHQRLQRMEKNGSWFNLMNNLCNLLHGFLKGTSCAILRMQR